MSKLDKALKALKKNNEFDKKSTVDLSTSGKALDCISTGSVVLDYLIGGYKTESGHKRCPGVPKGRITEIFGPEGSGKTTVAIHASIECQRDGGEVAYLDYENAFSPEYAENLGLDLSDGFSLIQPRHWEEGAEIIRAMCDAGVDLIVVDSVAAMKPKVDIEGDISDSGQIGHIARLQSSFLPKIVRKLNESNTALIYVNQLRARIKTSRYDHGPDEQTSGGKALRYYCSLRMKLKRARREFTQVENELTGDSHKQEVSNIVRAKNIKNKVSKHQGHTAEFVIRFGEGIDNIRSVIDIATSRGVIDQGGAWYTFETADGEEHKEQGKENLRDYFIENKQDFNRIVQAVSKFSQGASEGIKVDSDDDIIVEEDDSDA